MESEAMFAHTLFQYGPLVIRDTVVTTWLLMVALWIGAWLATRRLKAHPGLVQTAVEGAVTAMAGTVREALPRHADAVLPFVLSLWVFLVAANLVGLIPGLHSPTRDLSATAALAVLVFLSVHWFGIRALGFKNYLRHYLSPSPILLPFHIISEITRSLALAVRLFGNMMSLELVALLLVWVGGLLVPIPILMLHIVEALVQAYIFGMLALVYIAGAIQTGALAKASADLAQAGPDTARKPAPNPEQDQ
ncbi:MAG: F0F1 ATP synthase subunit A [Thiohalocapsa sp.]|jgi:F-type H+-transporting ATPase subunit a